MTKLQHLRLASIAGALLVGFWLPIRLIGFIPPAPIEVFFDLLVSAVSASNIYLHFRISGENPKRLRSWKNLGLFLDLICLMPFSLFAFVVFDSSPQWLLLINLLTARHIRKIKSFLDDFDNLQPITYRLIPLAITMPLLVHLIACAWIALGSGTIGNDPDMVLTYVRAIYWTFTTLTTVGYGDISAKTIPQMLFASGVQITGVAVFGYVLSNVASLLSRSDAAREHHMDNLDRIETFMRTHHLPVAMRSKVRAYYHYLWTSRKGYQDQSLLEGLPSKLQSELFFHINRTIVERVPFLKGASQELIEDLMNELEPRIFIPGERIFRAGDDGDALYLVHSGQVEVLSRENQFIALLDEGAFFGEMALVSEQPRSATVRAKSFCDLYVLQKESFQKVTDAYPEFRTHLEEVVRARKTA